MLSFEVVPGNKGISMVHDTGDPDYQQIRKTFWDTSGPFPVLVQHVTTNGKWPETHTHWPQDFIPVEELEQWDERVRNGELYNQDCIWLEGRPCYSL